MAWLALIVVLLLLLIVPTWLYERRQRSDYREFLRYQDALEAWRDKVVPLSPPFAARRVYMSELATGRIVDVAEDVQ
jgi:hypothetical protein